jgi:protein O-GlcNAc transferase
LLAAGRPRAALADADSALALKSDSAEVLNLRGLACLRIGEAAAAVVDFERALRSRPGYFEAAVHKGIALRHAGRLSEARDWLAKVEAAYPAAIEPRYNRALAEQDLGRYSAAYGVLSGVLGDKADFAPAWIALGSVHLEMGNPAEAAAAYRQAFRHEPWNIQALSGALLCQAYLPDSGGSVRANPADTERVLSPKVVIRPLSRSNPQRQAKLRVGFVSGDFREHVTVNFLEGVLRCLDRSRFELQAFSCLNFEDATTRRLQSMFDGWCVLAADDETARLQVEHLAPDILIDLSGHTAHNRLSLFATRLAPLQVTWLGYWATTGLRTIDYILVDPHAWRTEDNEFFTETPWPLPETRLCFAPPPEAPDIDPNLGDGRQIVFGAFGNPSKLNAQVIAAWGKILRAVPESRLWLKARAYADAEVRSRLVKAFEDVGVEPAKLIVEPYASRESYLANYNRVDFVLDTFPFPGGTTTAEALWMGVPVLTLAGKSLIARQGESMLINAGMDGWIARSEDDYVAKAVRYSGDIERWRAGRVGVREKLRSTPLFDSRRFAEHLGDALEKMWSAATTSRP